MDSHISVHTTYEEVLSIETKNEKKDVLHMDINESLNDREIIMTELRKNLLDGYTDLRKNVNTDDVVPYDPTSCEQNYLKKCTHVCQSVNQSRLDRETRQGITVDHTIDSYGMHNYIFQECGLVLEIMVYIIGNLYMVSVNDCVMPLREFLGVRHMRKDTSSETKFSSCDTKYNVVCDTIQNEKMSTFLPPRESFVTYTIVDTTVKLLATATTVLEKEYKSKIQSV